MAVNCNQNLFKIISYLTDLRKGFLASLARNRLRLLSSLVIVWGTVFHHIIKIQELSYQKCYFYHMYDGTSVLYLLAIKN
nr:hypothetical protein Iba_chr11cCG8140 [Ipomoea batatas]